jgi:hypothetical protein
VEREKDRLRLECGGDASRRSGGAMERGAVESAIATVSEVFLKWLHGEQIRDAHWAGVAVQQHIIRADARPLSRITV